MAAYALAQSWSTLTPISYVVKLYGLSIAYIVHQCTPSLHKESTDSLIRICNIYSGLVSPTGYYGLNSNGIIIVSMMTPLVLQLFQLLMQSYTLKI